MMENEKSAPVLTLDPFAEETAVVVEEPKQVVQPAFDDSMLSD